MKRYICLGLALMLILGVFAFGTSAKAVFSPYEDANGVRKYCACGNCFVADQAGTVQYVNGEDGCLRHTDVEGNVTDGCDGTLLQWKPWTSGSSLPVDTSGNFYLTEDVQLTGPCNIGENVSIALDLNGYTVSGAQNSTVYSAYAPGAGLLLTDTAGGGAICSQGAATGLWVRHGSLVMYGGTVDASNATDTAIKVSTTEENNIGLWNVQVQDDQGSVVLTTPEGTYLSRTKSSSNVGITTTKTTWKLAQDESGYYTIQNTNGDSRYLSYQGSGFKAYAAASSSRFIQFKLIPNIRPMEDDGDYVLVAVADGTYHAVGNAISGGVAEAAQVTVTDGYLENNTVPVWHVTHTEGAVTLTTPEGKYLGRTASSSNVGLKDSKTYWKLEQGADGYYTLTNENGDGRYLSYQGSGFKAYTAATATRFVKFMLIPVMAQPQTGSYRMISVTPNGYYAVGNTAQSGVVAAKETVFENGIPVAVDAMTDHSRLSMFGGTVIGGEAQLGGSIRVENGSVMNMYGGAICDGKAQLGGNIHNEGALYIHGGTISGGYAEMGGNIYNTGILQVSQEVDQTESAYTRKQLEDALVTAAWAYYLKEDKLQYCSQEITAGLSKYTGGSYRLTEDAAPEYGTANTTIYSVCSDFVYKVYYEALGHRLFDAENYLGATTSDFWLKSEDVALMRWINASYDIGADTKYGVTRDKELTTAEARQFMKNWTTNLRPGDVIVFTGHAFIYVGNGYVMDCRGEKYNESTGLDAVEGNGAVHYLHQVEALFLDGTDPVVKSYVINENIDKDWIVVFRPLDGFIAKSHGQNAGLDQMDMDKLVQKPGKLAVTQSRQQYPGIEIDRTVSITPYGTASTGEKLTYKVVISNLSNDPDFVSYGYKGETYNGLVVTEPIPEGTVLVPGSISQGGTCTGGVITWVVNLQPGEQVQLSYDVQVTASVGSTLVSGGGWVAGIPSNTISNQVGGTKLSADKVAALQAFAQTPTAQWRSTYNISKLATDLEFADRVYQKAMGIGLELPTVEALLSELFTFQTVTNASCSDRYPEAGTSNLFVRKEQTDSQYANMLVDGYLGGQRLYSPQRGMTINEFDFSYLEPGDILVSADVKSSGQINGTEVMVYCGNGTLVMLNSQKEAATMQASTMNNADLAYAKLWNMLSRSIFFVLRPSQAYENINTLTYDTSKEPTYGKEPAEAVTQTGAPLDQQKIAALQALTASGWTQENTLFTEEAYGALGIDITTVTQSFTVADLLKTELFFDADNVSGRPYHYDILASPAKSNRALAAMLVGDLRGGPDMLGYESNLISLSDLQVGDVLNLVNRERSRYWICVYQGDGKFLVCQGGTRIYKIYSFSNDTDFAAFLTKTDSFSWECYFVLRPYKGFTNINTVTDAATVEETAVGTVTLESVVRHSGTTTKTVKQIRQQRGTSITGGTATVGGNIYSIGSVYLSGGTVAGGSSHFAAGKLQISGNTALSGVELGASCNAVLKHTPVIDSMYIDNTGDMLPDVSELSYTSPIRITTAQGGAFAASMSDTSACFTATQEQFGVVYNPVVGQLELVRNHVHVSRTGDDNGDGSKEAPYLTLDKALTAVAQNGTVQLLDTVSVSAWNAHGKAVTITGGRLELDPQSNMFFIRDGVTFDNMTLWMPDPAADGNDSSDYFYVFCCGNKTVINQNVTVIHGDGAYDGINTRIFGGSNVAVESTDLTVLAGRWGWIYGGSYKDHISGDVHLTVGGDVNKDVDYVSHTYHDSYLVHGGSSMGDIGGTVYMQITGGNGYTTVYGGSNGTCSIGAVELTVTGGEGMSIYGGGLNGVNTIGQVNIYYQGGSFEQLFGGCLSKNLVGDVNLWLTGGKISRRVFGGCYNNTSGLSGFSTDHLVEGYINLYIGSGVNISLDYPDNDVSIYGHSRHRATNTDGEHSRIIFLDRAAYDAYGSLLGTQDIVMGMFMNSITVADYVCYMGWSADDEKDVISAGAVELEDHANNTLDLPVQTAALVLAQPPYIYEGTALTPAEVVCSDGWSGGAVTLHYEHNDAVGTATVTATVEGYSVSKTFEIRQYLAAVIKDGETTRYLTVQEAASNASGGYVQLLADSDEQITVSGDLYLDLNGHDLAAVTVEGMLYGMDSSTDQYSNANLGKLGCANNVFMDRAAVNGKRYLALQAADGSYSFHRVYMAITKLSLSPADTGFGYKAEFYADATALTQIDNCGYDLWLTEDRVLSCNKAYQTAMTLRLKNFDVENYGSAKVSAKVFMKLKDGRCLYSSVASYSMQDMVELLDGMLGGFTQQRIQAVKAMLEGFTAPEKWNIPNLKA